MFRNERRVDERSVVRGGATTHTRNIENVYEIFLCMRYQSFNPCWTCCSIQCKVCGWGAERAGGWDVGGRVVMQQSIGHRHHECPILGVSEA